MEQQIPGLVFAGYTSHPQVNGWQPVPLYDFAERTDGRPSINTTEGWNALAAENAVHNFCKTFGKDPPSAEAAVQWQTELAERELQQRWPRGTACIKQGGAG